MDEKLITIVIVAYNVSAFVEVSLYGLAKLTKNKYKVIICDNGSSYFDKRNLKIIVSQYDNIIYFSGNRLPQGAWGMGRL